MADRNDSHGPAAGTVGEPTAIRPDIGFPKPNRFFERIPFAVSGVDIAAASQGTNFDTEKVNIAWRQALSLWTAVAPVSFDAPFAGEEPLLRIRFESYGYASPELGNTSPPLGLPTSIGINCDNKLFIDRFLEKDRLPSVVGPFDLIGALAHEIGHALGIDHPPVDPQTGQETEYGLMSASHGEKSVWRQLFPYDIREVQRLHGAIRLAEPIRANLAETGQLIDASPGVVLQHVGSDLLIFGPMETRTLVDVLVPAKDRLVSALRLNFTTITMNVFVNRVEAWDGFIRIQQFSASSRCFGGEGLAGRTHILQLGFLQPPSLTSNMLVRLELVFTDRGGEPQSAFGVVQVHEVGVETLPVPVIDPGVV